MVGHTIAAVFRLSPGIYCQNHNCEWQNLHCYFLFNLHQITCEWVWQISLRSRSSREPHLEQECQRLKRFHFVMLKSGQSFLGLCICVSQPILSVYSTWRPICRLHWLPGRRRCLQHTRWDESHQRVLQDRRWWGQRKCWRRRPQWGRRHWIIKCLVIW